MYCYQKKSKAARVCRHLVAFSAATMFTSLSSHALDYGVYDARALAMGGTTVAAGGLQHAHFYNPALLALSDGDEESTRKGRVYLPQVVAQYGEGVESTVELLEDDLAVVFDDAVAAYNNAPSLESATIITDASRDLANALRRLNGQALNAEAFIGISVSEPSDRAGGAFYFGARVVTAGDNNVAEEDLTLLNDYAETATFIATGGAQGTLSGNVLDADGNLIDPTDTILSTSQVASAVFSEWGVAVSKEFELWGQYIALGAVPKLMRVDAFRENIAYSDSETNYSEDKRTHLVLNADIGVAMELGKHYRIALASKDIIPQSFETDGELEVKTRARTRLGGAYVSDRLTLGLDVDLQKNTNIASNGSVQHMALGAEWRPWSWTHFRFGYRHDLEGDTDDLLSGGVGLRLGRFVADASYATSSDVTGAALQLGWTF